MTQGRKRGRLNDDDLALWRKVADRTEKLDLKTLFTPPIDAVRPPVAVLRRAKGVVLGKSHEKKKPAVSHVAPSFAEPLGPASVQMDKKAFGKLKRGKLRPDSKLDLHGMTMAHAHPVLNRFILNAHQNGLRLVLVVTGKGKIRDEGGPIPTRYGVLRHQVLHWLDTPPLAQIVMQVSQAHISHGGGGAYYVYLRRHR